MATEKVSISKISIKYGLIAFALMVVYFLIMRAIAVADERPFFRVFNYVIIAGTIWFAYREVTNRIHHDRINYLPGLGIGMQTTIYAALLFSFFMIVYAGLIDKGFTERLAPHLPFPDYINPGAVAFVAGAETAVAGIISSFILMQFFKRNRIEQSEAEEKAEEKKIYR